MLRLHPGPVAVVQNRAAEGAEFHHGRFERGKASSGAGLGLVIVNALAEANGVGIEFHMQDGLASIRLAFPALAAS